MPPGDVQTQNHNHNPNHDQPNQNQDQNQDQNPSQFQLQQLQQHQPPPQSQPQIAPPTKRDFSEEGTTSPTDPNNSDSNKKRRTTGASSRGVANLTPDQLAKKRANDREAQRAIRERTRSTIENLERKIRELTSQQPYQELQHVLRQKELVEAENADIKKRLASVLSLIQPVLGQHG
jgi:hypothetical protein